MLKSLVILGLITAILSYFCVITEKFIFIFLLPGMIYGIGLSVYFYSHNIKKSKFNLFSLVFISTLAYFLAVLVSLDGVKLYESYESSKEVLQLLKAGLVGGVILASGLRLLIYPIQIAKIIILTILSGLLSLSLFLVNSDLLNNIVNFGMHVNPFLMLYIAWQVGMNLAIGWSIQKK